MHITNLREVGGSVVVAVPPAMLELLHLSAGAEVALEIDNGRLVVDPRTRPRYTLDELLAECDASADLTDEDRDWLNAEPVGDEVL